MNKFQKLIADTSSATLQRRAGGIATQAEIAQQTIVNQLKSKVTELELKVENLTDFAPSTTESLRPGNDGWDLSNWAVELQRTKWDLHLAEEQLKIAQDTYNEYFTEEKK
jgi:hypothetical protein